MRHPFWKLLLVVVIICGCWGILMSLLFPMPYSTIGSVIGGGLVGWYIDDILDFVWS